MRGEISFARTSGPDGGDVSGADRQKNVVRPQKCSQRAGQLFKRNKMALRPARFRDFFEEPLSGNAFDRLFPRRIDVGEDQHVGFFKNGKKFLECVARPGVPVRLEGNDKSFFPDGRAQPLQGRGDLGRVVSIIVINENASLFPFFFHAPAHAAEGRKGATKSLFGEAELKTEDKNSGCIFDIMLPG